MRNINSKNLTIFFNDLLFIDKGFKDSSAPGTKVATVLVGDYIGFEYNNPLHHYCTT